MPSRQDPDLEAVRDPYHTGSITLEDFESQVAEVLEGRHRPHDPAPYRERWEIHIHDAPAGHSLHIHLP